LAALVFAARAAARPLTQVNYLLKNDPKRTGPKKEFHRREVNIPVWRPPGQPAAPGRQQAEPEKSLIRNRRVSWQVFSTPHKALPLRAELV